MSICQTANAKKKQKVNYLYDYFFIGSTCKFNVVAKHVFDRMSVVLLLSFSL